MYLITLMALLITAFLITGCQSAEKRPCRDKETGRYTECK